MYRFGVISLLPELVAPVMATGVVGRAAEQGLVALEQLSPREFTTDRHRTVDDRPYGGGPGMVMSPDPLEKALKAARQRQKSCGVRESRVIYFSPQGQPLTHARVKALMAQPGLILLCGRYEGVDERLIERQVDEELSIGDYVLSGGELAAAVLVDAVARLQDGALNDAESAVQDSFEGDGLLDCPHYTRPVEHEFGPVPGVLLSGNHAEIARWRRQQSLGRTWLRRPDLLDEGVLSKQDRALLDQFKDRWLLATGEPPSGDA